MTQRRLIACLTLGVVVASAITLGVALSVTAPIATAPPGWAWVIEEPDDTGYGFVSRQIALHVNVDNDLYATPTGNRALMVATGTNLPLDSEWLRIDDEGHVMVGQSRYVCDVEVGWLELISLPADYDTSQLDRRVEVSRLPRFTAGQPHKSAPPTVYEIDLRWFGWTLRR